MCPHNEFVIVYYKNGIMVRRCTHCGTLEIRSDWDWTGIDDLLEAIREGTV